jgi:hypothetical protein
MEFDLDSGDLSADQLGAHKIALQKDPIEWFAKRWHDPDLFMEVRCKIRTPGQQNEDRKRRQKRDQKSWRKV